MILESFLRPHRVLIGTVALLMGGLAYGVYSRAADEQPQGDNTSRREVSSELADVSRVIGGLNQSYVIPPVISCRAATGGSYFIDTEDSGGVAVTVRANTTQETQDDAEIGDGGEVEQRQKIKLPPPLFLKTECGCGCGHLPCWLQGGVGWLYGEVSKPTCVQIPRPVAVRPSCGCSGPCHCRPQPHPGCGCQGPCHHRPRPSCGCHGPCHHHPSHVPAPAVEADKQQAVEADEADDMLVVPPAVEPANPPIPPTPRSVLKPSSAPAATDAQQQMRDELERLRREVERLQDQLNQERHASLRDMDA